MPSFDEDGSNSKDPGGGGGGGGSSDFGDITGWPGASTDFVRGDGSDAPLSAAEMFEAQGGSGQYALATGGATDYVVTPATPLVLANGARILVRFPSVPANECRLNVSGTGYHAVLVKSRAPNGRAAQNGDFLQDYSYEFYYLSDGAGYWVCKDGFSQKVADLPALVPGDMPASPYLEAPLSSQTLLAATAFPGAALACGTPGTNTAGFTYSSGVWTATIAGWYEVSAYIYKYPYSGNSQINFKKNGAIYDGSDYQAAVGSVLSTGGRPLMYHGIGETFSPTGFVTADIALDVSNLYGAHVRAIWRGR